MIVNRSAESEESSVLMNLSLAFEKCDMDTMQHCLRVGTNAKLVMEEYQRRYSPNLEYSPRVLQWAATLHDIGKIRVPLNIIMKPTGLNDKEKLIMMKHAEFGDLILSEQLDPDNRILRKCAHDAILYHHERYDGNGYPNHLVGNAIPLAAQMVGLADCYDALVSARPYKSPYLPERAYQMIMNGDCGVFSDEILSCLPVLMPKKTDGLNENSILMKYVSENKD